MKKILLLTTLILSGFCFAQVDVVNVSTVTGSSQGDAVGSATAARFWGPHGIAYNGNIAITDTNNNKIKYTYSDNSTVLLAGSTSGFVNGTGAAARFNNPTGIARLRFNDFVVCDTGNNVIRKVTSSFPLGVTTTYAGTGVLGAADGHITVAQFNQPIGIAVDTRNDDVYVADTYNHRIRKISAFTVSTFAGSTQGYTDGTGTVAQFDTPMGLVVDSNGNVFVIDKARIRKITPTGVVTTFAGGATSGYLDGTGTAAQFANGLSGITIDTNNNLYVTDAGNLRVRKITPAGVVTTYAGTGTFGAVDGDGSVASFSYFTGITYHTSVPYKISIADYNNNRIRSITGVTVNIPTISAISSVAGDVSATINYTLNANNGATTSVINYGLSSGALTSQATGFSASGNTNISSLAAITGLAPSTTYYFQVAATNAAGTATSLIGSFTTTATHTVGPAIAEYRFDNNYTNVLGTNPFSSNAGTTFTTDRFGNPNKAININNTGSSATITGLPYGNSARTISLWAKINTTLGGYNWMFSYGQTSVAGSAQAGSFTTSDVSYLGYYSNVFQNISNALGTWYHFVYVYDGTTAKIYKNGSLIKTTNISWNTLNDNDIFSLGKEFGGAAGFNGAIDDLKIYDRALSQADITSVYTTLSTANFNQNNLQALLYPNPAKDVLNISIETELKSIEIYNLQGQKVLTSTLKNVNIAGLSNGIYLVRIEDDNNAVATQKLVIE